jgi:hypothetical protein
MFRSVILFSVFLAACGSVETDVTDDTQSTNQAVCSNPQGINSIKSNLAVTIARELKRWEVSTDFEVANNKLQLSAVGLARCDAVGEGCSNTKALLQLQNEETAAPCHNQHNPANLASELTGGWSNQAQYDSQNPAWEAHEWIEYSSTPGACGADYWFAPVKAGTTTFLEWPEQLCFKMRLFGGLGSMNGITCNSQNDYLDFRTQRQGDQVIKSQLSGKCLQSMDSVEGSLVKLNACTGANNQKWTPTYNATDRVYTLTSKTSGKCLSVTSGSSAKQVTCNASSAAQKQQFRPRPETKKYEFVNFANTSSCLKALATGNNAQVAIDSCGTMNTDIQWAVSGEAIDGFDPDGSGLKDGPISRSGSCNSMCEKYSDTNISGVCCYCAGVYSTFVQSWWNTKYYYCQ